VPARSCWRAPGRTSVLLVLEGGGGRAAGGELAR
jgi:hypothetical protein